MNERQKRLIEVYDHLRRYYGIHTKTGFAETLHYGRTSMSAAMNGDESYLTDNLFKNICDAYPDVFNIDYLLTGKGELLTAEEDVRSEDINKVSSTLDQSSLINAALAAKDETIKAKEETILSLRQQIASKDALIESLRQQLATSNIQAGNYPFATGVAEDMKIQPNI